MWNLWLDRSKRSADTAIAGRCRRLPSGSAVRRFLLVQGKHAGLYAAAVQQIQAWVASGQLSLPPVSKKFDLDNIHEVRLLRSQPYCTTEGSSSCRKGTICG